MSLLPGKCVVLFALEREAAPFRRAARGWNHIDVYVSGVGQKRARLAADRIVLGSPSLVIAAGFCGALTSGLAVGDVVKPAEVVDASGKYWACSSISSGHKGRLVTVTGLVTTHLAKLELAVRHGASAVDMESAAIAEVCAAKGIPFAAVRAVSDTVDTELSPELVRLLSGGRVSVWKAVKALLRKPSMIREFRRLARDTRLAGKKLAEELAKITARS